MFCAVSNTIMLIKPSKAPPPSHFTSSLWVSSLLKLLLGGYFIRQCSILQNFLSLQVCPCSTILIPKNYLGVVKCIEQSRVWVEPTQLQPGISIPCEQQARYKAKPGLMPCQVSMWKGWKLNVYFCFSAFPIPFWSYTRQQRFISRGSQEFFVFNTDCKLSPPPVESL